MCAYFSHKFQKVTDRPLFRRVHDDGNYRANRNWVHKFRTSNYGSLRPTLSGRVLSPMPTMFGTKSASQLCHVDSNAHPGLLLSSHRLTERILLFDSCRIRYNGAVGGLLGNH